MEGPSLYNRAILHVLVQLWDDLVNTGLLTTRPDLPTTVLSLGETIATQTDQTHCWEKMKATRQTSSLEEATAYAGEIATDTLPVRVINLHMLVREDSHYFDQLKDSLFGPAIELISSPAPLSIHLRTRALNALILCAHLSHCQSEALVTSH